MILRCLWSDIELARNEGLPLLNALFLLLLAKEVYKYVFIKTWDNAIDDPVVEYDMRSIYSGLWGRGDGYLVSAEEGLVDLKLFIQDKLIQFFDCGQDRAS